MLKRLSTALLFAGLVLGLTPGVAAAFGSGPQPDNHYRCMYQCDGNDRYGHDRYDHGRNRAYHNGQCWEHDSWGWHRCRSYRYGHRYGYGHDRYYDGWGGSDGADSHRQHSSL